MEAAYQGVEPCGGRGAPKPPHFQQVHKAVDCVGEVGVASVPAACGSRPWPLVLGCPFSPANFLCVNGEISCYSILQDMLRLLPASREGMWAAERLHPPANPGAVKTPDY